MYFVNSLNHARLLNGSKRSSFTNFNCNVLDSSALGGLSRIAFALEIFQMDFTIFNVRVRYSKAAPKSLTIWNNRS